MSFTYSGVFALLCARMRQNLSLFFLVFYAISFTEFHQALRLPLLIEHYKEHSAKVDLSFWEFLVMHYETDAAHDETDNNLPFKDCGHSVCATSLALLANSIAFSNPDLTIKDHQSLYLSHIPQLRGSDIFQPPKF
jgi:hypothetical protein